MNLLTAQVQNESKTPDLRKKYTSLVKEQNLEYADKNGNQRRPKI